MFFRFLFISLFSLISVTYSEKPNIILIMTDDMGYSDLGCYGSEIETPHLDQLAQGGLRFSQFYNTSKCCPSRASLMTGLYSHQAGVGNMMNDKGEKFPGYRGRLMPNCLTIAEALQTQNYLTIQTGKWHLGDRNKKWWAANRGFEKSYSCPQGGGFFFRPSSWRDYRSVVRGTELLYDKKTDPPKGWYSTDAYTDEGLIYAKEAIDQERPFFWYLAYNAPHFPLQAKEKDIAKYRGRYKALGWDKIRQQRYEKLIELGLIEPTWKLPPRDARVPAWETLTESQKNAQDERMATYAAMIDCIDQNIGKIIQQLKQWQAFENTLILFLHDNGASNAGGNLGSNKSKSKAGTAESEVYYGTSWANVSDTPFQEYKSQLHEGGIASPLIAHWPKGIASSIQGKISHEATHLIDIMPTCLEISQSEYPTTYKGHEITPLEGKSLNKVFQAQQLKRQAPLFFEYNGYRAMRSGDWKILANKKQGWKLFHMGNDRTELNDLAQSYPEKVKEMATQYQKWAKRCNVITKD